MSVSIIIPNYNGLELLKKNLPFVLIAAAFYRETKHSPVEIVVIDDASTDGSQEFLNAFANKHKTLDFKTVLNEKNLGFSSTVNKGVSHSKNEIVVLLNTDVLPQKDFLLPLITHFSDEKVFAIGCMDRSIEGNTTIQRGRGIGKWIKGFLMHSRGEVSSNTTLWVSGGSGAFRKSFWIELGGMCSLYDPFYWEDIDLSYRAQKNGYKVLFEKESVVTHEHELGIIKTKYKESIIKKISYRNQFYFVWINITDKNLLISHLVWLPYHLLNAIKGRDSAFLQGFCDAFFTLPKVIQYRNGIKKVQKVSDASILKK